VTDVFFDFLRGLVVFRVGVSNDADEVVLNVLGDGDFAERVAHGEDVSARGDGQDFRVDVAAGAVEDFREPVVIGEGDQELEKEAVKLRLRQRIGAVLLDRVLGGEDEKRGVQRMSLAGHGHAFFLHRFQQSGLGLGRGAVDFISQKNVAEDRAALEFQGAMAVLFNQDLGADDIAGEEVGGELDAAELEVQRLGQGVDQRGLAEAGHPFQQHIAPANDRDEDMIDNISLANDELGDFGTDEVESGLE